MTQNNLEPSITEQTDAHGQAPKLSILLPVVSEGIDLRMLIKLSTALLTIRCEIIVVLEKIQFPTQLQQLTKTINHELIVIRPVENQRGPGIVNALKVGFEAAKGERVLIFAADEVGPILAIDDMLDLMDQGCDFVSCTRYAHGGRRLGGSTLAHVLSRLVNWSFGWLADSAFTDATNGIKMMRRDLFEKLALCAKPTGWAIAFEMSIKAQEMGLKIGEVPIISIDRLYGGKSRFNLLTWSREYFRWFYRGRQLLKSAPRKTLRQEVLVKTHSLSVQIR